MLRCRINKLIRILESEDSDALTAALDSAEYMKALNVLDDSGCVKVVRDMNGTVHNVWLLPHYATYQLNRREVWLNRFVGFLAGAITSVVAHYLVTILGA